MSAPTPGPWEFVHKLTPSENHRGFFIRAEKPSRNGKWALAEVQPGDEDGTLGLANARLIAAAPDLLAALESLVSHAQNSIDCRDEQMIAARAAIAAATGEQR